MAYDTYYKISSEKQKEVIYSEDYRRIGTKKTFRFKGYWFMYGPQTVTMRGESRLAEYRYINRSGVEYTKLNDTLQITFSGVWIKDSFGKSSKGTAQYQVDKIKELHKDLTPGTLEIPGFGTYTCIMQDFNLEQNGDYPDESTFDLTFLEHTAVTPFEKIAPSFEVKQEELPTVEQRRVDYTIKSGDTLSRIASQYGVSLIQLKAWNPNLFDAKHRYGNLIRAGELVAIQKSSTGTEPPKVEESPKEPVWLSGTTSISRDKRLTTAIENKGLTKNTNPAGKVTSSGVFRRDSRTYDSYFSGSPGDKVNVSSLTAIGKSIGPMVRKTVTTAQRWLMEGLKNGDSKVKNAVLESSSTIFPVFGSLIQYPSNRTTVFTSSKPVKVTNSSIA